MYQTFNKYTWGAMFSQLFGYMMDSLDLTLIISTGPVLARVLLPPSSLLTGLLLILFAYSTTIIFRPLGSAIFGNLGDKIGRRDVLMITIAGFSVAGAFTSILPTYEQVGILSFALFLLIRAIVGIFAGGEYAAGHPFAIEWTPKKWRGIVSGVIQSGFNFGAALAALVTSAFISAFGLERILAYAWRYVFLASLIPLAVALPIRLFMPETPIFHDVKRKGALERVPIASIFKPPVLWTFLQVMLITTGLFLTGSVIYSFIPVILENKPSILPLTEVTYIISFGNIFAAIATILIGAVSQFLGRRLTAMSVTAAAIVLSVPLFYGIFHLAAIGAVPLILLLYFITAIVAQGPWGVIPAYLVERFATTHRASGVGFGYSSGIFLGGWFSFYVAAMHNYLFKAIDTPTNIWFSTAVLLIIGATLAFIGFFIGPETKDIDIA